jgi:hypothetical protein
VTKKCSKCDYAASHIPRLSMFAFTGATPAVMFFDYPVCRAHMQLRPADLVTDQSWTALLVAIVGAGKLAPRRDLNRVECVLLRSLEAREFYRVVEAGRAQKVLAPSSLKVH